MKFSQKRTKETKPGWGWLLCGLCLLLFKTSAATVPHKGASNVMVRTQAISVAPPKSKSLTTAKGTKAAFVLKNPFNISTEIQPLTRTNLYWEGPVGANIEFEIIETTNLVDWRVIGVTKSTNFYLGPVQPDIPLRLFRVGAYYLQ